MLTDNKRTFFLQLSHRVVFMNATYSHLHLNAVFRNILTIFQHCQVVLIPLSHLRLYITHTQTGLLPIHTHMGSVLNHENYVLYVLRSEFCWSSIITLLPTLELALCTSYPSPYKQITCFKFWCLSDKLLLTSHYYMSELVICVWYCWMRRGCNLA